MLEIFYKWLSIFAGISKLIALLYFEWEQKMNKKKDVVKHWSYDGFHVLIQCGTEYGESIGFSPR